MMYLPMKYLTTLTVLLISCLYLKGQIHSTPSVTSSTSTNNSDSAIFFFGKWSLIQDAPGFYSKDYKTSNIQYNRCVFNFKGTAIKWIGAKNNNHGFADVYVDNVFQKTVDSYSATLVTNAVLFELTGLSSDTLHTITIEVRKDKNDKSIGSYQVVDFFESQQPVDYVKDMRARMDAEYAQFKNNSKSHSLPETWKPVEFKAVAPKSGVTLQNGVLKVAFNRNIDYLNHCIKSPTYCNGEGWSTWLPAANEGRMLSGAANALRWEERKDMRMIVDTVLARIKRRQRADGFYNYYPDKEAYLTNSERKNYDRLIWTTGLLDAGKIGYSDAYTVARKFYNWFNKSPYLSTMLIGDNATNAFPGGGLVYLSPVGVPEDLITTQKYLDQDYWIHELKNEHPLSFSNYPGNRPHTYDLLGLEAFLDEYTATGNQKYIDAVKGGWNVYKQNYEHIGGATAICEVDYFPPKSYYINSHTGETCGSVFWININTRLLHLYPEEEKYAAEIEKSIYNVMLAAQDTNGYIRYHTKLHAVKDTAKCYNSCCEATSTNLISKLPQYIYSVANDGLYVNFYAASNIEWPKAGSNFQLRTETNFPFDPKVAMIITTPSKKEMNLRIRIPSWLAGNVAININGKPSATGKPSTYVSLNRKWSNNDKITFTLPLSFSAVKYTGLDQVNGNMNRYALLYGPLLMALQGPLIGPDKVPYIKSDPANLQDILSPVKDSPLQFHLAGYGAYKFVPYWQATGEFTCFPIVQNSVNK
jgi:hypothetical protein